MVKRTVLGAACVLLALGFGILGETYLRGSTDRLLSALEVHSEAPANTVLSAAETALEIWDRASPLLGALIKHSDADTLGRLFVLLRQSAAEKDAGRAAIYLRECAAAVRVLCAGERLQWQTILLIRPLNNVKILIKPIYF